MDESEGGVQGGQRTREAGDLQVLTDVSAYQVWWIAEGDGAVLVVFCIGILAYQVLIGLDMKCE